MKALLAFVLVSALLTFGCIILRENIPVSPQPVQKACTMEAKLCPDGSAVGRNAEKNCEFDPCPVPQLVGNDSDGHGCKGSAGYTWCEPLQKCIRPWEQNCTAPLLGGDRDEHGCIDSAGYSWCETLQQCIRPWETNCTATAELEARNYCRQGSVYICGGYAKVVRPEITGGPTRFYELGTNKSYECPAIAPEYMPPDCGELLKLECDEAGIC